MHSCVRTVWPSFVRSTEGWLGGRTSLVDPTTGHVDMLTESEVSMLYFWMLVTECEVGMLYCWMLLMEIVE